MRVTRRSRPRALQFESLESMTLLSGLAGAGVGLAAKAVEVAQAKAAAITVEPNGPSTGIFSATQRIATVGTTYKITTAGRLAGLGEWSVSGSFTTTGAASSGEAGGSMTVTTAKGKIYLVLTGPVQTAHAAPPAAFQYTVTGGTGIFKGGTGTGTVGVALTPLYPTPKQPYLVSSGVVTLTFHAGATLA